MEPPPIHMEETSTHREHQDDIDVVQIRPLNNISAFNFDCQQMHADRLNDHLSPLPKTRRNIFSIQPITDDQQPQQQEMSSFSTDQRKSSIICHFN